MDLTLDDLRKDDYAYLSANGGFTLNNNEQTVKILDRTGYEYVEAISFKLVDCRTVKLEIPETIYTPSSNRSSGAAGIGQGIGENIGYKKAQKQTLKDRGLRFRFKSIECPEIFINIPDEKILKEAYEAVCQFFEDGKIIGQKWNLPENMEEYKTNSEKRVDFFKSMGNSKVKAPKKTSFVEKWTSGTGLREASLLLIIPIFLLCALALLAFSGLIISGNYLKMETYFEPSFYLLLVLPVILSAIGIKWLKTQLNKFISNESMIKFYKTVGIGLIGILIAIFLVNN